MSIPNNNQNKHKLNNKTKYLKTTVSENLKKETLFYEAQKMLDEKIKVRTDGLPVFKHLNEISPNDEKKILKDK